MATVVKFTEPNQFGSYAIVLTHKELDVLQRYLGHSSLCCDKADLPSLNKVKDDLYILWEQIG